LEKQSVPEFKGLLFLTATLPTNGVFAVKCPASTGSFGILAVYAFSTFCFLVAVIAVCFYAKTCRLMPVLAAYTPKRRFSA
jgi:hypothetical protein